MTLSNEPVSQRRAAVYRLYDASGRLLYVGSSYAPARRCAVHRRTPWWPRVAERADEWHPHRSAAYRAEAQAIEREMPEFNRLGTADYNAECSERQRGLASVLRSKCAVAAEARRLRLRVAAQWRAEGYCDDRATAEGMLAERAFKEESGVFPDGVEYPPLATIEWRLSRARA